MIFHGNVVAEQIAGRDITNFNSFDQLLDRAVEIIKNLDGDQPAREEAQGLIEVLRGRTIAGTGLVLTGAGGSLLANVLARLLDLPT